MSRTRRVRLWPTGEARPRCKVVTLTDCTVALSEEEQRLAVTKNYPMLSRPLSHAEFLAELGGKTTGGEKSRGYERA